MVSTLHKTTDTLGDNMGLVAAVIAVVVAQILKPFSEWTVSGRFKPGLAVGSGGFPSSHSSLVTALATGAAYQVGLADPAFATALVLALVVRLPNPRPHPHATIATPPTENPPRASDERGTDRARRERRRTRRLPRRLVSPYVSIAAARTSVNTPSRTLTRAFRLPLPAGDVRRHGRAQAGWLPRHRHQQPGHGVPQRGEPSDAAPETDSLEAAVPSSRRPSEQATPASRLESGLINGARETEPRWGTGARHEETRTRCWGMDDEAEPIQQGFQDFLAALQERPLREHIGHTPVQVLAGGVLGVVVGSAYAFALRVSEGPVAPAA